MTGSTGFAGEAGFSGIGGSGISGLIFVVPVGSAGADAVLSGANSNSALSKIADAGIVSRVVAGRDGASIAIILFFLV